jgi:hypothetical protein
MKSGEDDERHVCCGRSPDKMWIEFPAAALSFLATPNKI